MVVNLVIAVIIISGHFKGRGTRHRDSDGGGESGSGRMLLTTCLSRCCRRW